VLRVDLTTPHVYVHPLMRALAQRSPLSSLAAGHSRLVAATNGGYYDFATGDPLGPVVVAGALRTGSTTASEVVGVTGTGRVRSGTVALAGTATSRRVSIRVHGLNTSLPVSGLTVYTARWGSAPVPLPRDAVSRKVAKGLVASGAGRWDYVPASGQLLVARGSTATTWLRGLRTGAAVQLSLAAVMKPTSFRQAYAVGSQLVAPGGITRTGLRCRTRYPQPARTAVGLADGGRILVLTVVEDHPGTSLHGLDSDQMARVMHDLGVSEAYLLDGSGSSEMLARMPANPTRLSLRNYPADGQERTMPLGLGIFAPH
jgi:hypothetical protein